MIASYNHYYSWQLETWVEPILGSSKNKSFFLHIKNKSTCIKKEKEKGKKGGAKAKQHHHSTASRDSGKAFWG
jgi:hypothetical protein